MGACVGIVGGLGVGATIHYYERITAACAGRGVVPDLVFVHADANQGQGFVRAGRLDQLADYLAGFIDRLGRAGADVAVMPAVTPHIALAETLTRTKVPILSIFEPLAAAVRARKLRRVALFGTIFTMQGSLWGALNDVEIVKAQPAEMAFVGEAYQRILDGKTLPDDADGLRRIARELARRDGVECILLAGTDLAVMFKDEAAAGFPCLDVAQVHIDAIVEKLCAQKT
ncbi:MAG TPA: aspartate/glutamate racemase family protein [Reyranella sp.]|jgi:aspartate racemase|nr:aspartate/glutamate racemase family protein [Reyranella sp.]